MAIFKEFEWNVVEALTGSLLSHSLKSRLKDEAELVELSFTGCGYFLTVRHDELPATRIVCDQPMVIGDANGITTGFVVFLENYELTLECHSLDVDDVPEDYRERDVSVTSQFKLNET